MPDFSNFSSLPPNQEVGFIPYEERMHAASQKSFAAAIFAAIATFVIAIGIYLGVAPDDTDVTKDMNMSNLSRTEDTGGTAPAASAPAASGSGSAAPAAAAPAADGSGSASASGAAGSAAPAAGSGSASGSN
jgi:hypothetical protein